MKIIELLNKIANNEDVPKKIKYDDMIFKLNEYNCYINDNDLIFIDSLIPNLNNLNDEVEIIEDEKEIQSIETLNPHDGYFRDGTELVYKLMYDKINEIAMKVNKLDKNIKELR